MTKMTATNVVRFALFAAAGAAACAWAPHAGADDAVTPTDLGMPADVGGGQQWAVTDLRPSAAPIAAPAGSLWEATATSTPSQGGIPVVPGFAARTADGDNYPVLWTVPTPLGINPAPLQAGESTTGKLYFDVTGTAPDSVTYARDGRDVAVWVQPPPAVSGAAPATYGGAGASVPPIPAAPVPVAVPRAEATAPAPAAAGSSGTPAPAASGSSGTPAPAAAGSAGVPQPATGSVGPPATPNSTAAVPAPMSTTPAPASASPATTSPTAGTAPAANTPAPTPGSSGTTFTAPTTTPVLPVPATGGQ